MAFEPASPGSEWTQTHAVDRDATGIDIWMLLRCQIAIPHIDDVLRESRMVEFFLLSFLLVCSVASIGIRVLTYGCIVLVFKDLGPSDS